MLDMNSFGNEEPAVERDDEPQFRPDSPLLDNDDFSTDQGASRSSQGETMPVQRHPQPKATEDPSDAAVAQYEKQAPSASPAAPESPVEPFQFDPRLTFPAATQDASPESGSDRSAFAEPMPLALPPLIDPGHVPWPAGPTAAGSETPATP